MNEVLLVRHKKAYAMTRQDGQQCRHTDNKRIHDMLTGIQNLTLETVHYNQCKTLHVKKKRCWDFSTVQKMKNRVGGVLQDQVYESPGHSQQAKRVT